MVDTQNVKSSEQLLRNRYPDDTLTSEFNEPTPVDVNDVDLGAILLTPTSGSKIRVIGYYITAEADQSDGYVRMRFATSDNTIGVLRVDSDATTCSAYVPVNIVGAIDEVITIYSNMTSGLNYFVSVNYQELT